jgi:hypothetical protein
MGGDLSKDANGEACLNLGGQIVTNTVLSSTRYSQNEYMIHLKTDTSLSLKDGIRKDPLQEQGFLIPNPLLEWVYNTGNQTFAKQIYGFSGLYQMKGLRVCPWKHNGGALLCTVYGHWIIHAKEYFKELIEAILDNLQVKGRRQKVQVYLFNCNEPYRDSILIKTDAYGIHPFALSYIVKYRDRSLEFFEDVFKSLDPIDFYLFMLIRCTVEPYLGGATLTMEMIPMNTNPRRLTQYELDRNEYIRNEIWMRWVKENLACDNDFVECDDDDSSSEDFEDYAPRVEPCTEQWTSQPLKGEVPLKGTNGVVKSELPLKTI